MWYSVPFTVAATPLPVMAGSLGRRNLDLAVLRRRHDPPGDRVLRLGFDGCGDPQRLLLRETLGHGEIDDPELAERQGPRLSK
jgi:hypothetical protein